MKNWKTEIYTASELTSLIESQKITVPQYQRGQVWDYNKQKSLIDSIKRGYPFGTILLYYSEDTNSYRLIDGLQRSTTIAKFIKNPSEIFDNQLDISDEILDEIISIGSLSGNMDEIKGRIRIIISEWITEDHTTLKDINGMQYYECAVKISNDFPSFRAKENEVSMLLKPMLENFKIICDDLLTSEIPAIVYSGSQENLPEIFSRINSQGTKLSKYQILAATWSHINYKVEDESLTEVHKYIDEYFTNLLSDVPIFKFEDIKKEKNDINLFQIIFGFSKLLSSKFPFFFSEKSDSVVESSGFNLVTACIGLKNKDMFQLDEYIKKHFNSDKEFNVFLVNILKSAEYVEKVLKPYLEFKNNKRDTKPVLYHTEMQICSIIASVYINKHGSYGEDGSGFTINNNINSRKWNNYHKALKENLLKRYFIDILNNNWRGSGDNKLNEIIWDPEYYTGYIDEKRVLSSMESWYEDYKYSTSESKKVSSPSNKDKLVMSIIYANNLPIADVGRIDFDFEHLATKKLMKDHLQRFKNIDSINAVLPISSVGNICLLPQTYNRRKKELTIYQDENFKDEIGKYDLTLEDIEKMYSFTDKDDLMWIEDKTMSFSQLKDEYYSFIDKRFSLIKDKVILALFKNYYK